MRSINESNVRPLSCLAIAILIISSASAQLLEVPVGSHSKSRDRNIIARTEDTTPIILPFWDDFSNTDALTYPQERLWSYGTSVFLNNGIGIKPPSKNAVTLDGVDALGKPYNVNDMLAKGFADSLVSQPIRMDLVDPGLRNTVYISFYYQVRGLGEPPDPGDRLSLSLRASDGKWETVFAVDNDNTLSPDVFYPAIIQVSDPKFFHDNFQIRFHNFARLSGPYDTWNIDYVYLNSGRDASDLSFPDRTVSSSLTSLFVDYFSIPVKHFLQNVAGNIRQPGVRLYNLKPFNDDGLPHQQPFDYTTKAIFTTRVNGIVTKTTIPLDQAQDPGTTLKGSQFFDLTLNKIPPASAFNPLADSIVIEFNFGMATNDNVPAPGGDYKPAKYSPIDFRFNDSTKAHYTLTNYYAYDDGSAEYGAGLNQTGSFLAYKFTSKANGTDFLSAVDIYFPEFGDNTSQSLLLQVRSDLSDAPASILHEQPIQVSRTTQNHFVRYELSKAVGVSGSFYVGWKQLSTVPLPAGLDKNTDNGDKVYYNTNGLWIQNTTVKGSLMMRPIFGDVDPGTVTGLEGRIVDAIPYPNPVVHTCYLDGRASAIRAFDITGRPAPFETQTATDRLTLTFGESVNGLVILQYMIDSVPFVRKVMVRRD